MPNYCHNYLTVDGPAEDVHRFVEESKRVPEHYRKHGYHVPTKPCFMFSGICPMPEEIVVATQRGGESWYEWSKANWGTKWELREDTPEGVFETDVESARFGIVFNTAWTPPLAWMLFASIKFPTLEFTIAYEEFDMEFAGIARVSNGQVIAHVIREISKAEIQHRFPEDDV